VEYLGIDWSYRRAAWCSLSESGGIAGEGAVPADADGLARLVIERGMDVRAVVEMTRRPARSRSHAPPAASTARPDR
jgi:hypothetical protein